MLRARPIRSHVLALGALIGLSVGCAPDAPGEPIRVDLAGIDPDAAALIGKLIDAIEAEPALPEARANLGMAYEVNGLNEAALSSYEQAVTFDPGTARWHYYVAQIRSKLGDLEEAVSAADRVLERDAQYAPAYLYRGQWQLDLGRNESALQSFERATELAPAVSAGWVGLARASLRLDRPARAVEVLEAQVARQPGDAYLHQLLGLAYREVGDLDRATTAAARGRPGLPPKFADPWHEAKSGFTAGFGAEMRKAENALKRGGYREALGILEPFVVSHPNDPALLSNLSVAYRNLGQPERALELLQTGVARNPDFFALHLNLALAYERQGAIDKALEHLERVHEIKPDLAVAYQQEGLLLMRARRFPEALEAMDRALRYDARNTGLLVYGGVIHAELRQWDPALERLERAIEIDPSLALAHVTLARVQMETGDFSGAEASLDQVERIDAGNRMLQPSREELSRRRGASR